MQQATQLLDGVVSALNQESAVDSGVWIGDMPLQINPEVWAPMNLTGAVKEPLKTRFDLAVINLAEADPLSPLHVSVITRFRDLLAKQVLVATAPNQCLFELGFKELETATESTDVKLWQYNILSYKQVPDWLNSKYWANPENWGKYRW